MPRLGIRTLLAFALTVSAGCHACCTDPPSGWTVEEWTHRGRRNLNGADWRLGFFCIGPAGWAVILLHSLADAAVQGATPDDVRCDGKCCAYSHSRGRHRYCHCSRACPCWTAALPGR